MKIKLYGHEITIEIDDNLERKTGAYGVFSVNTMTITLDGLVPQSIRLATLIHECMEALNYFSELNLQHNVISSITTGIFALLAENKDITQSFLNLRRDYRPPPRSEVKSIYDKPKETIQEDDTFKVDYKPFDNTITAIMEGLDV